MSAAWIDKEKEGIVEAARRYAALGLSVIPLRGKVPAVTWREYQTRRASVGEISRWARRGLFDNVGIVCGAVSGNPAVLAESYTVASGGGGWHVYLRADGLPLRKRIAVANIYCELCCIQGRLESCSKVCRL